MENVVYELLFIRTHRNLQTENMRFLHYADRGATIGRTLSDFRFIHDEASQKHLKRTGPNSYPMYPIQPVIVKHWLDGDDKPNSACVTMEDMLEEIFRPTS